MSFVRLITKRPLHLNLLYSMSPLVIRRCSDRILNDSNLGIRSYWSKNIVLSFTKPSIPIIKRFKYKKTIKEEDVSEEFSDEDEDYGDTKPIVGNVSSLRTDAILKAGLGLARNKIENYFYESKIRVNGKKIQKKSQKVKVGDEIDIIKGNNPINESLINISRVVLVSVKANEEGDNLKVKLKRYKSLSVEDYSEPWKMKDDK